VIRRGVLARLLVFTVIAVLGIGYVLYEYVGVGAALLGRQYTVYLDLPDSGGIFSTASVTYRGVEIGRVGAITLRPGGIRVALNLSTSYKIPSNVAAYVATGEPLRVAGAFAIDGRSAVFVDGVDGDPSNVVGLSLPLLRRLLAELGVAVTSLWR